MKLLNVLDENVYAYEAKGVMVNKWFKLAIMFMHILSKKPSAEKSSPQMAADQEMLRPKWWQIKKWFRPTYSLLFVWLHN